MLRERSEPVRSGFGAQSQFPLNKSYRRLKPQYNCDPRGQGNLSPSLHSLQPPFPLRRHGVDNLMVCHLIGIEFIISGKINLDMWPAYGVAAAAAVGAG